MKKKKLIITVFCGFLLISPTISAQSLIMQSGASLIINSGSTVIIEKGGLQNDGGIITNNGTLNLKGDIVNNSGDLFDDVSTGTTNLLGDGVSPQEITGGATTKFYGTVNIDNSLGVNITNTQTGADQEIHGLLNFTDGKLTLNDFNLFIGTTDPTGYGYDYYIVTNSTGALTRNVGGSDVIFPVGNIAYNSVVMNNAGGTPDNYSIIAKDGLPPNFAGTDHAVNRHWDITEEILGGSNLTIELQWNHTGGEELPGFNREYSSMGHTSDGGATVAWGDVGAATGTGAFYYNSGVFNNLSDFMVADDSYKGYDIDLKVWLAGAYNEANGNMDNNLNTAGGSLLIPLTDPYGLNVTVPSIHADIVDWVKVELRELDRTTVVKSYAKFVDINGQVVNYDGTNMTANDVDYDYSTYSIAVMHRNHFGVVTDAINTDLRSTPTADFATAQTTAWQDGNITTNAALKEVETGVFGLWDGDGNANGSVVYNGGGSDRVLILDEVGGVNNMSNVVYDVYYSIDLNMDRKVVYNGGGSDRVRILDNVGGVNNMSNTLTSHLQ